MSEQKFLAQIKYVWVERQRAGEDGAEAGGMAGVNEKVLVVDGRPAVRSWCLSSSLIHVHVFIIRNNLKNMT